VSGLDAAVSGLLGSEGVFSHHEVTEEMRDRGRDALVRVDALHLAAKRLTEMSTGERRRVLIARALVTQPDALLLDEPTTGLDFVARHRFMESVRRLAQQGTTVILVTHHVEEIIPEIRRVVLLQNGGVAVDGPPDTVLTGAHLTAVYGADVHVERSGNYFFMRMSDG
jgi:iron complex transport system ATP-binding protein